MSATSVIAGSAPAREQRQILDYVGAMSRELSRLAEQAGDAGLAGALWQCSEKASAVPSEAQART